MSRLIRILIPLLALIGAQLACVQDCSLSTFKVIGYVKDQVGNPISEVTISARNNGSFEKLPFNVMATSDASGYFETESASSFACTPFEVTISADGYKTIQDSYYPPGEEWPHELPPELTI